ncbi:hypothetical protein [Paenibacillus sp. BJ-4]|uniref:hypothetical protein n=1 Tax=Paenibacillus sp. BJ-4 TaxID=2878097 RepID=UPI001CF021FB|nr:hypothetical protein [Paenibacillus sp. BJ-4]
MLDHLPVERLIWSVGIRVEPTLTHYNKNSFTGDTSIAVHLNLEKRQRSPLQWDSHLYVFYIIKESHCNSDRKIK